MIRYNNRRWDEFRLYQISSKEIVYDHVRSDKIIFDRMVSGEIILDGM